MIAKTQNNDRYFSGLLGEKLALNEFRKKGFSLLKHRYKTKYGEIDLIVENQTDKILIFVEVKRRKEIYDYSTVITQNQWHKIYNAGNEFLAQNCDKYKNYSIRYDAFICFTESKNYYHIENIFPMEK